MNASDKTLMVRSAERLVREGETKTKRAILSLAAATAILLLAARPAFAHHSRAMFDMARNITFTGVVNEYQFKNPHSHIIITVAPDAKDPSTVGTWDIEASSISVMVDGGWNRTTYKPGDPITLVAHPMKNGSRGALLFYAIKPDGTRLYRAQRRYADEVE
jgi:hypothetical protein